MTLSAWQALKDRASLPMRGKRREEAKREAEAALSEARQISGAGRIEEDTAG